MTTPENSDPSLSIDGSRSISFAASVLGSLIGLEVMMTLFAIVPPPSLPAIRSDLLPRSVSVFHPEADLKIYIGSIALSLVISGLLGCRWFARYGSNTPRFEEMIRRLPASILALGMGSVLVYALLYKLYSQRDKTLSAYVPGSISTNLASFPLAFFVLTLPGLITFFVAFFRARPSPGWRHLDALLLMVEVGEPRSLELATPREGWYARVVPLCLIALGIFGLLWLPRPQVVAGQSFTGEFFPFHHWDFFAMGPALAYRHEIPLAVGAYSQYGLGYPMIVNWLSPMFPLSYGNFVWLGSIYACLYFLGLAGLLRSLTGSWGWAATGVMVAIHVQFFHGVFPGFPILNHPSSSILRYSMDVWFFWSLLLHLRSGRLIWMSALGATAGLGFLLGLDTGIYLNAVLLFYLGLRVVFGSLARIGPCLGLRKELLGAGLALLTTAATIIGGVSLATRRSPLIFDHHLLTALFESVLTYTGGMGCVPMVMVSTKTKLGFAIIVGYYLYNLARSIVELIGPGTARRQAFRGCLSAYGLCTMMLLVQRSVPQNLFHVVVPFVILAVDEISGLPERILRSMRSRAALTLTLATGALVLLASCPALWEYPGLLQSILHGFPNSGTELKRLGVAGLPANSEFEAFARDFERITLRLRELHGSGRRVAVIDEAETMFLLAADLPPWDRFTPLVTALLTRSQLDAAKERFLAGRFDVVMLRDRDEPMSARYRDDPIRATSDELRDLVAGRFVLAERVGHFSLWFSRAH